MATRKKSVLSPSNLIAILSRTPTYQKAVEDFFKSADKKQWSLADTLHQSNANEIFKGLIEYFNEPAGSEDESAEYGAAKRFSKDRTGVKNRVWKYKFSREKMREYCERISPDLSKKNERDFFMLYGDVLPFPVDLKRPGGVAAFERIYALNRVRTVSGEFCSKYRRLALAYRMTAAGKSNVGIRTHGFSEVVQPPSNMLERIIVVRLEGLTQTSGPRVPKSGLGSAKKRGVDGFSPLSVIVNNSLSPNFYLEKLGHVFRDHLKDSWHGDRFYLDNSKVVNWECISLYLDAYDALIASRPSKAKVAAFVGSSKNETKYRALILSSQDIESAYMRIARRGETLVSHFTRYLP